jgi:hypothetical protein
MSSTKFLYRDTSSSRVVVNGVKIIPSRGKMVWSELNRIVMRMTVQSQVNTLDMAAGQLQKCLQSSVCMSTIDYGSVGISGIPGPFLGKRVRVNDGAANV